MYAAPFGRFAREYAHYSLKVQKTQLPATLNTAMHRQGVGRAGPATQNRLRCCLQRAGRGKAYTALPF